RRQMDRVRRSEEHWAGLRPTKNSIWLLSATGEIRTAEPTPGQGRTPAWSPDGKWLTFESTRGSSISWYSIFIMTGDGTSLRQITGYELDANHPGWSPDGGRLVFSARHPAHTNTTGIAITDVGGHDDFLAGGWPTNR